MGSKQVRLQSKQRVPVSPEIVCMLGSNVSAAYFYTQLLYYDRYDQKDTEGWFGKTTPEVEADIGLGRRQQEHSRKILEQEGLIETRSIRGGRRPMVLFRVLIRYDSI